MNTFIILNVFVIYSFFGWILESVYKSFYEKKFINSGFLAGPFCPIYGLGAIIMYLFLSSFEDNILILFVMAFIILSILEYMVGYFLEIVFYTKYWDYSNKKFNFQGRICLENSIYWGILGVIFIKVVNPGIIIILEKVPSLYLNIIIVFSFAYIVTDFVITSVRLIRVNIKVSALEDITSRIEKMLPDLNKIKNVNKTAVLRGIVKIKRRNKVAFSELNSRRIELINKIEKQTKRIRRAFPSMKSDYLGLPYGVTLDKVKRKVIEENTDDIEKE